MFLHVDEIRVGERIRTCVDDDILPLCQSIQLLGQLQPILIDRDKNLLCGARRLRACELLQCEVWAEEIGGLDDLLLRLRAEQDENTCHKPFTPSEMVAMGAKIEAIEKPKAAERKAKHGGTAPGKPANTGDNLSPVKKPEKTRSKVAKALGVSEGTYDKAKAVVAAAEKPDAPKEVVAAAKQMDVDGKVDKAFKAVVAATTPVVELPDTPEVEALVNAPESPLAEVEQLRSETGRIEDRALARFASWVLSQSDIEVIYEGCRIWVPS